MGKARSHLAFFATVVVACISIDSAPAQEKNWEREWQELLLAAKKEGRLVIKGPPEPEARNEIPARFRARFGITVEYVAGRGTEIAAKLRTERQAGLYTADVFLGGILTISTVLHPEKMIDPLRPTLVLPEVIDPKRWKKGKLPFVDPEGVHVLRLYSYVDPLFYINTSQVKREELKSMKDLLQPKWKRRIAVLDPTVAGSGGNTAAQLYLQFGEEFVKRFYIDQQPAFSRDSRQIADWLAHGTYPITPDASSAVERSMKDGFPITPVYALGDAAGSLSSGNGHVALMNRAPHPNAARLFVNWIASKEGLEIYARALLAPTTRSDIDESYASSDKIPRPDLTYFDGADWGYNVQGRDQARMRMKEMLKR